MVRETVSEHPDQLPASSTSSIEASLAKAKQVSAQPPADPQVVNPDDDASSRPVPAAASAPPIAIPVKQSDAVDAFKLAAMAELKHVPGDHQHEIDRIDGVAETMLKMLFSNTLDERRPLDAHGNGSTVSQRDEQDDEVAAALEPKHEPAAGSGSPRI